MGGETDVFAGFVIRMLLGIDRINGLEVRNRFFDHDRVALVLGTLVILERSHFKALTLT
jgi:hypothetical protein